MAGQFGMQGAVAPAIASAFLAGHALFLMLLVRKWWSGTRGSIEIRAGERRDRGAMAGVILQGLAFALCAGRLRVAGPFLPVAELPRLLAIIGLMTLANALFGWASGIMGRNWAIAARTRHDHQLVTSGPFAHVRHPIYVALFALLLATALSFGTIRMLPVAIAVYAAGTAIRVSREERLLRARFGEEYLAYATRVKRFMPGLF